MPTQVCLICGRTLDLDSKFEKAPGKEDHKKVCITCTQNLKTTKAPSP